MDISNKELIGSACFSGADINVYVMVNPGIIFKQQKELMDMTDNTLSDTFLQNTSPTTIPNLDWKLNSNSQSSIQVPALDSNLRADTALSNLQKSGQDFAKKVGDITSQFKKLADLQTLSYSIYRDKLQVKALGQPTPKGYTRGFVTFAGTMIFTVFYEAVLNDLFKNSFIDDTFNSTYGTRIDQLPPLDIFIVMTNETGQMSKMGIFGVEFMNEGQVMSIQDLMTENSVNYVARHITRLQSVDKPYASDQDMFGLTDNLFNRKMLGPEEYQKAQNEIQAQRQYFL